MKKHLLFLCFFCPALATHAQFGKLPPFTKWHQKPLSFQPLELHSSNAIIIPGIAAGLCL